MGKVVKLRDAITLIWETVKITEEQGGAVECPYVFIVGAGISAPEMLTAGGIIQHCKEKVINLCAGDDEELGRIMKEAEKIKINTAKYYSYWFEQAYKNKIHRQQYLKRIINNSRISTSNLLLAQILNSRKIATTVITPNFDNHLLKSLNLLGNYDVFTANNVMDNIALNKSSKTLQIMHVHGTYEFYDCCNLENEITKIASGQGIKSTAGTIEEFLKSQSPIIIGYSGWEDDVIMSKLKERLQYAAIPYKLLWFCFSAEDYEILPEWLKDSEDVVFVLPERKKAAEDEIDKKEEDAVLPSEDVLSALITKFEFEAPNLFRNPIQYYIELIDGFLPENIEIFPVKSWKRRLDYIEGHLGDIEKQIIALDDAAARKDIVDITRILKGIDYIFIPMEDMEHILDGVILPLVSSKNRIEDVKDLLGFLDEALELLLVRSKDMAQNKLLLYLNKIILFLDDYKSKIEKSNMVKICDKVLTICKSKESCEEVALTVLGIKSDLVDGREKAALQNEIIERGKKKIENTQIARCMLVALYRQIMEQGDVTEDQEKVIDSIKVKHEKNEKILEFFFNLFVDLITENIVMKWTIEDLIMQITEYQLSPQLLLYARRVQCLLEEDDKKSTEIAVGAIEGYNIEEIIRIHDDANYAALLGKAIVGKRCLGEKVEQKYIDYAFKLCDKEEHSPFALEILIGALSAYIRSIENQFKKRELCKKAIIICDKNKLYEDWIVLCYLYMDQLEGKEQEDYLLENTKFATFLAAEEKASAAKGLYMIHDIEQCKVLMLESSEEFDRIFDGQYNPALGNIGFMVRRNEMPEFNRPVMEILDRSVWEKDNAFLNINKALVYLSQEDWRKAREEIRKIETDLEEAVEWWSREDVVGKKEKNLVLLLLVLEEKLDKENEDIRTKEFWEFCAENITMPEDIVSETRSIRIKYIESCKEREERT